MSKRPQMTERFNLKLSPELSTRVKIAAAAHGWTPSEWVRVCMAAGFAAEDPKTVKLGDYCVKMMREKEALAAMTG